MLYQKDSVLFAYINISEKVLQKIIVLIHVINWGSFMAISIHGLWSPAVSPLRNTNKPHLDTVAGLQSTVLLL